LDARKAHAFSPGTEASLDLPDDPLLLDLIVRAGFEEVLVGIESPIVEILEECRKIPNRFSLKKLSKEMMIRAVRFDVLFQG
jgi:radical SAM superfamily enzyme YgiQ (UPF0313 family)